MPFVTIEDVRPFLPEGLISALNKEDLFDKIEAESAQFVNSEFGIEIPSNAESSPCYIKRPMAMIIQKFARVKVQNLNSENFSAYETMVEKEFNWAYDLLSAKSSNLISDTGTFIGIDSW